VTLAGAFVLATAATVAAAHPAGAQSTAAGEAQAKAALLRLSDFPSSWTAKGEVSADVGGSPFPGAGQLATCMGVPESAFNGAEPEAQSPEFDQNAQNQWVQDEVQVFPSAHAAASAVAVFANPKAPGCLQQILGGPDRNAIFGISKGQGSVGRVSVTSGTPPALAQHAASLTMVVPITTGGVTVHTRLTTQVFSRGRDADSLSFYSIDSRFPAALAAHLGTISVNRAG